MVDRLEEAVVAGVPEGRVPMGATEAPDWLGLDPGARSREGDPPVGLEVLVRLWGPTALSKTRFVGPEVWGLAVLWGREAGSAGGPWASPVEPGVPASPAGGARPMFSKAKGECPRMLEAPLGPGAPVRTLPVSSTYPAFSANGPSPYKALRWRAIRSRVSSSDMCLLPGRVNSERTAT